MVCHNTDVPWFRLPNKFLHKPILVSHADGVNESQLKQIQNCYVYYLWQRDSERVPVRNGDQRHGRLCQSATPVLPIENNCTYKRSVTFQYKTPSWQYMNAHYEDKTVLWPAYNYNMNPNSWKGGLYIEKITNRRRKLRREFYVKCSSTVVNCIRYIIFHVASHNMQSTRGITQFHGYVWNKWRKCQWRV